MRRRVARVADWGGGRCGLREPVAAAVRRKPRSEKSGPGCGPALRNRDRPMRAAEGVEGRVAAFIAVRHSMLASQQAGVRLEIGWPT